MPYFIKNSIILGFLFHIHMSMTVEQPEVINIHTVVKSITHETDCNTSEWKNDKEDACACCLLFTHSRSNGKKSADTIIQHCTKTTQQCNDSIIASFKEQLKIKNGSSQELINKLARDGLVVKKMDVDTSFFNQDGILTETSLPKFLSQAFTEKKLTNNDFSKEACLKAKNLGTQGGYNTLQLFLVTSTCHAKEASMYIVKEARHGLDEAVSLATIAAFPKMKDLIAPKITPGLPTLSLPIAYFSYPKNNAIHYIATMPAAKGKDLATLTNNFRQDQTPQNKEKLNRAFAILGKETANFHKRFMKAEKGKKLSNTVVHGDFHVFNLFFDEIGGHFTFIDNETIAQSLKNPVSPSVDLVKLFFMPFSTNTDYQQFRDLIAGIDLQTWFDIALKNFVTGYKDAYPAKDQKQVLQELQKMFTSDFKIQWVDFYDVQMKELRDKYIDPIFNELLKNSK
jgi:hypothetical protein